jgi:molybdopterin-guanine dinucleotide biosynthesis protein A
MDRVNEVVSASAVLLAGGRSRRMNRPKALLPFAGQPLIVRVLECLSHVTDDRVVVAAPGQDLPPLKARVVRDPVPYLGPVAGLAGGLAAARGSHAFVTSCDAPFLNSDLVRWLLKEAASWDVVVPRWEGRLNPLHAVYATSLAEPYQRLLDSGHRRPVDLYDQAHVRYVTEEEVRRLDPEGRSFLNMNSPEEYQAALDIVTGGGG